jgi:2-polyprenyl-6-methoxyphenol hydroxylase-like FAD-dependent oxidoreductase
MRVAINGAGIAGTTLAWWLRRFGHEVLIVEKAHGFRTGGYLLDLWGIGYDVAEKMGVLPRLQAVQYHVEELRILDRQGRVCGGYPTKILSRLARNRLLALARSDIAATIHGTLDSAVETIFGDSICAIRDDGNRLGIGFDHAPTREVDLVVGADGLRSRIRSLAFGSGSMFEHALGCHVAAFELSGYRPRQEGIAAIHGAPGRYVSRISLRDDKTLVFMVFRNEYFAGDIPANETQRKSALHEVFGDMAWECPQILSAMADASDIYFDSVSQIRMERWTKGRVALVGDAAACPSLIAGEGAGLAMAEAYVLAGEIHASRGDLVAAFARYEERMKPFLLHKQKAAQKLVGAFVPKNALAVAARNFATRLMRLPVFPELMMGRYLSDAIELPEYKT